MSDHTLDTKGNPELLTVSDEYLGEMTIWGYWATRCALLDCFPVCQKRNMACEMC